MRVCPHRPPCPGCPRFGEAGVAPSAFGSLEALAQAHGLPSVEVVSGATTGFRRRARLAIRGRVNTPKIGLFELGTHRVVHIPRCSVHHPLINRVADVVRRSLVDAELTNYSDIAHAGVARYLQVVVERSSQRAQVVVVANTPGPEPLQRFFELIRAELGPELHSLWFNSQCEHTNTILGERFVHLGGPATVVERFGGPAVHYPPGAFGQNNLEIAERIIEYVRTEVTAGARVTEFYAGVGALGLSLLDRVSGICFNEVNPHSLQGLALGIEDLAEAVRAKVSVVPGSAGEAVSAAAGADVVIVDPPRKGLDAPLLKQLATTPPARVIYVSCAVDSLLADVQRLTTHNALRLTSLRAFNLLPYTEHVETVACFDRT